MSYVETFQVITYHRRGLALSRMLCSLTFNSVNGQCCCLHGLKPSSEDALDNHIYLRHHFYNLHHHLTDLQKPAKEYGSR